MTKLRRMANSPHGKRLPVGECARAPGMTAQYLPAAINIRWDLYKEAGYPKLESYDEDLLDVMEAMQAPEPETADGQKTYGCAHGSAQDRLG